MANKSKFKILVLHPGALPGYTSGDTIENPTDEQILIAKADKQGSLLRLVEVGPEK